MKPEESKSKVDIYIRKQASKLKFFLQNREVLIHITKQITQIGRFALVNVPASALQKFLH